MDGTIIQWRRRDGNKGADFWTNRVRSTGTEYILYEGPYATYRADRSLGIQLFTDGGLSEGVATTGAECWLWHSLATKPARELLWEGGSLCGVDSSWDAELTAVESGCEILLALHDARGADEALSSLANLTRLKDAAAKWELR